MTARTRYFVIVSLLMLGVGLGTGLVAYYVGLPPSPFAKHAGPEELEYVPGDAVVVAFANVQEIMHSDLRQKLHQALPAENGQAELKNLTGIDLETDVQRVVACLDPRASTTNPAGDGLVLVRGNFDETKIEALMRDHGGHVEDYKGKRLIVTEVPGTPSRSFALSFFEPGLVALGTTVLIREAVDVHDGGGNPAGGAQPAGGPQNVIGNDEVMTLIHALDSGNNAWAVGRFDVLTSRASLPANISSRLPAITWFSAAVHVNGGVRGTLRAETRDADAAKNLHDVVNGFIALGKLQAGSRPDIQLMMQSLQLQGDEKSVSLSFDVPAQVFDAVRRQ